LLGFLAGISSGEGHFMLLAAIKNLVPTLRSDRRAVTAIEYALIAALIAVVIIGALTLLGTNISGTFNMVSSEL
jgi:pilus assembly protein Flp/PilA